MILSNFQSVAFLTSLNLASLIVHDCITFCKIQTVQNVMKFNEAVIPFVLYICKLHALNSIANK